MSMKVRETNWKAWDFCKDANGEAHFPDKKLEGKEMDMVKLGKAGGYYPKMGGGKTK